jgi:adenylate cyclase
VTSPASASATAYECPHSDAEIKALFDRQTRRMTIAMVGSNLAGGVAVTLFAIFMLSGSLGDRSISSANHLRDVLLMVAYVTVASVVGPVWSRRRRRRLREARESRSSPTDEERRLALALPLRQLEVNAVLWGIGCILSVSVSALDSWDLALTGGVSILLGGLVTCTLSYLLAERLLRDTITLTLAGQPPAQPVQPGVATRMLLAGVLGAGVPFIAIAVLATLVLADESIKPTRLAELVLVLGVAGLLVSLTAVYLAGRSIADPLASMRGALARLRAGDTGVSVEVYDGSEVGLLQAGFNEMVAGLREREQLADLFGRHVGVDVARRALERGVELGGETRAVSVMYVDIVGSTWLAATRTPERVVDVLNRFFATVIDVVTEHGGWINKFEGDAALCVFGAPVDDPHGPTHALAAARSLGERIASELREIELGIGVAHGDVVAGNIGAAERFEYTVIGDPVNEAARLSELAKRGRAALASNGVLRLATHEEALRWRLEGEAELRGRTEPTVFATPRRDVVEPVSGGERPKPPPAARRRRAA